MRHSSLINSMRRKLKEHRKATACVLSAVLALALVPSQARADLFGITDAIYWVEQIALMKSQFEQMKTQYEMVKNNLANVTNKSFWMTYGVALGRAEVQSLYNENSGWNEAVNQGTGTTAAWKTATLPIANTQYLASSEVLGKSAHLSNLASVEQIDGSSPNCLAIIGQYRSANAANQQAYLTMQQQQLDASGDVDSEIQQLNLLNGGEMQSFEESQAQGAMQSCMVEQTVIANSFQRNMAAEGLNTWEQVAENAGAAEPIGTADAMNSWIPQ